MSLCVYRLFPPCSPTHDVLMGHLTLLELEAEINYEGHCV